MLNQLTEEVSPCLFRSTVRAELNAATKDRVVAKRTRTVQLVATAMQRHSYI